MKWCGPNGIQVEAIVLNRRPLLKVTQHVNGRRYLLGYCATTSAVSKHVDLADLCEVYPFPRVSASASRPRGAHTQT